jgi:hypothetical protein
MPRRLTPVLLALAALALPLAAAGPTFWTVATSADFLAGRSDGVVVSEDGVLSPGPALASRLTSAPPQVWALAAQPDGTIWAGTGGDGNVLRIRPGARDEVVFDAAESHVFALALSGARVYAATGPDGRVHAIEADGTNRVFFDPEEKYIWALAVDAQGRVWVGAGSPAVIYRVEPDGASRAVYRPPAAHVVSLAFDPDGRLLAGTGSPGRLYRLDADGRPFAVLDSGLAELRAVAARSDGVLFAAAVGREGAAADSGAASIAVDAATQADPPSGSTATPAPSSRSQIFRIAADGLWEPIWQTPDVIYDLADAGDGGLLVATGPEGRLIRIGPNREVHLLTGVDARQITRFGPRPAGAGMTAFATANPGRVVTLGDRPQSPATYDSAVRDTRTVATWGLLRWEGSGDVQLYSRSGNTARPDDSWSAWAGPYTRREGEATQSPAARFIQWRAVLASAAGSPTPSLTSVTLAYLPRNTRPVVTSVTLHPPGVVFQRTFSGDDAAIAGLDDLTAASRRPPGDTPPPSALGRRMFQRGLQTVAWKAEDADGDRLSYAVAYRRDGEQTWRELRSGLLDTLYVWDTTTVGDGRYVLRLEATDAGSNTAGRALTGLLESDALVVDNTPPAVSVSIVRQPSPRLLVELRDALSPIARVEYSVAGGAWQLVYPADGLADSPVERYEIVLPDGVDPADVVIRATDALQNVVSQPAVR